jgi:hypothetical protein
VLGEYGISVVKGQVTILGATLSAGKSVYTVHAASSHSLPVIRFRASKGAKAEIRLHDVQHGLRSLGDLSPLFSGLWNYRSAWLGSTIEGPLNKGEPRVSKKQSFHIVIFFVSLHTSKANELISSYRHQTIRGMYSIQLYPPQNGMKHCLHAFQGCPNLGSQLLQ